MSKPEKGNEKKGIEVPEKLKSRKFWFGVGGAIAPILTQVATGQVGWTEALAMSVGVAITYILGQGAEDVAKHKHGPKKILLPHEDA